MEARTCDSFEGRDDGVRDLHGAGASDVQAPAPARGDDDGGGGTFFRFRAGGGRRSSFLLSNPRQNACETARTPARGPVSSLRESGEQRCSLLSSNIRAEGGRMIVRFLETDLDD